MSHDDMNRDREGLSVRLLSATVAVLVVMAAGCGGKEEETPATNTRPAPPAQPARVTPQLPTPTVEPRKGTATKPPMTNIVLRAAGADWKTQANEQVATVNGVPIRLIDVVGPLTGTATVDAETYARRLDAVIAQEVVLQEAKASGLELSTAQQAKIDSFKNLFHDVPLPTEADQAIHQYLVRRQQRQYATEYYLGQIMADRGVSSAGTQASTAEIDAYYRKHKAEFPAMPADAQQAQAEWAKVSATIQARLADEKRQQYAEQRAKLIEDLRSKANVKMSASTP